MYVIYHRNYKINNLNSTTTNLIRDSHCFWPCVYTIYGVSGNNYQQSSGYGNISF